MSGISAQTSSAQQWLRACSLIVADDTGNGVELAGAASPVVLRIRFTVTYFMPQTPAMLHARVYNLSKETIQKIVSLASKGPATNSGLAFTTSAQVVLMAGYINNLGKLFKGQIFQLKVGYESSTDSYLDIFAADGNYAHAWDVSNTTFASGYTAVDAWNYMGGSLQKWGVDKGAPPDGLPTDASPRGKVIFGKTTNRLTDMGSTYNFTWNILDGQLQALPKYTVRPGQSIQINRKTGQIGFPEQTDQGVTVTCLLNPAIRWGTHIVLNNEEITRFLLTQPLDKTQQNIPGGKLPEVQNASNLIVSGNLLNPTFSPPINADGNYTVLFAEHVGDTRGNEWVTKMTCLSVDPTAPLPLATPFLPDISQL